MKYSYDEKCLDLARYFFPSQSIAFLEALAQEFQDCVEGREDTDDKTLPIPDFLRNQDNLRAEGASTETPVEYCKCSFTDDDGTIVPGEPCRLHPTK